MKKVIVGHRGVGKSDFLKRHQAYLQQSGLDILHLDLDQEIEKEAQISIEKIFEKSGENYFRSLEIKIFNRLFLANKNFVISLGAGFNLQMLPTDVQILFVSRASDKAGRIFLNRPRLNKAVSALAEYTERFAARQSNYLNKATSIYFMPEGLEELNTLESQIVKNEFTISDCFYTLTENELPNLFELKNNYKKIELRSDLLNEESIRQIVKTDSTFSWIVSVRTEGFSPVQNVLMDYDQSLMSMPSGFDKKNQDQSIVSSHIDSLDLAIESLIPFKNSHLKLSPLVENFEELWTGHRWQQESPATRSFLPRSRTGKWTWFRQQSKYFQKINFVRNFLNLSDQPSPYQWLSLPEVRPTQFAAVLGTPIGLSRSPQFHHEFFNRKNTYFSAIEINESEFQEFYPWLVQLGLGFAAVTSPLKKRAYEISSRRSAFAENFRSVNTLVFLGNNIYSQNTDIVGFKTLIESASVSSTDQIAVWGGGGTLEMMKSILPQAHFFSSRTATLKDKELISVKDFKPDILIWSASRNSDTQWPIKSWKPRLVIDLNYFQNSMGLEYAQKINAQYLSGLTMFNAQALEQQTYWSQT